LQRRLTCNTNTPARPAITHPTVTVSAAPLLKVVARNVAGPCLLADVLARTPVLALQPFLARLAEEEAETAALEDEETDPAAAAVAKREGGAEGEGEGEAEREGEAEAEEAGDWPRSLVIDTRDHCEFRKSHIRGAWNVPIGHTLGVEDRPEEGNFGLWLGALLDPNADPGSTPPPGFGFGFAASRPTHSAPRTRPSPRPPPRLFAVAETDQVRETVLRMARVGVDSVAAVLDAGGMLAGAHGAATAEKAQGPQGPGLPTADACYGAGGDAGKLAVTSAACSRRATCFSAAVDVPVDVALLSGVMRGIRCPGRHPNVAGYVIVDCRTPGEFGHPAAGHVYSAVNVPLGELRRAVLPGGVLNPLKPQCDTAGGSARRRHIVYCASGYRSAIAASIMEAAGLEAGSLEGGYAAVLQSGDAALVDATGDLTPAERARHAGGSKVFGAFTFATPGI
jgi:rhodanese-related sulfurtransferase